MLKIIFANQLRGFAALLVVLSHLGAVFWGMREQVAHHIGSTIYDGRNAATLSWFSFDNFNIGAFGVGIFFLISGFVIPFSLVKMNRLQFLTARFFRIYPTYFSALALPLAIVWFVSHFYGNPFPWDFRTIIANFTLMHPLFNYESIDLVNWTLSIELKFYIVAAVIAPFIRRANISPLLILAALVVAVNVFTSEIPPSQWSRFNLRGLVGEFVYIPYMMIGVLFNYSIRGRIGILNFVLSAAVLFGVFFLAWKYSIQAAYLMSAMPSYGLALALFGSAYLFRNFFRPNRILDFFADISYPLYIVHSLLGYAVMRLLLDHGVNVYLCEIIGFLCAVLLACAIHFTIERRTAHLGRYYFPKIFLTSNQI